MTALLIGCGNSRDKRIALKGREEWSQPLVTLDMDPNCGADHIHDLEIRPLPFDDETFDEIAAYDVLEHVGRQGDWRGFFDEFAEYWRILKPEGTFGIIVPIERDALADIGHTRFFAASYFRFLDRDWYAAELAQGRHVTDYRWYWKFSFKTLALQQVGDHHLCAILQKA